VTSTCWFARLGYVDHDGPLQRAHWIPKQRLRQAGLGTDAVWDPRVWRWSCMRHHHKVDNGFIDLNPDDFPAELWEYAAENRFSFNADRGQFYADFVEGGRATGNDG